MSVLKSENYLYFQNKASHYNNIRTMRAHIEDQLPLNLRHTIDHSHTYNRDLPYNRNSEIQFQNHNRTSRIKHIANSNRKIVQAEGSYSRYHRFQRSFRKRNPFQNQEQRLISIENQKYKQRISSTKPAVGHLTDWNQYYSQKQSIRQNMSRYVDGQKSKGDLQIKKEPFLLDTYLKYLDDVEKMANKDENPEALKKQNSRIKHIRIQKERLFILPSLNREKSTSELQKSTLDLQRSTLELQKSREKDEENERNKE